MKTMPVELCMVREETTVIGNVDDLIDYIENGQAQRDWYDRITIVTEECDCYLKEHRDVWSNIIIQRH